MVNVAIIGMGNMGCNYATMISKGDIPEMKLVAVTRIKDERYQSLKDVLPSELKIFQSSETLFQAFDEQQISIDTVLIVTPHYSHEEIALNAFTRGLNVLCDKPAGVYSRQARRMTEAYLEAKKTFPTLKYGLIFQQRTYPVYQKIRQIVQNKTYGELRRINWIVTDWYRPLAYYAAGSWKATWAGDGGGVVLNQCPHNLDLLQWICGMPSKVQAFCGEGKYHPIEVEDEVTAYFEWKNGATGVFISSTGDATGINRLEISLENAMLVCQDNQLKVFELDKPESEYKNEKHDFFSKPKTIEKEIAVEKAERPYEKLLEGFAGGNLIADGSEAINSLYISNAIYLSSWENRQVFIPEENSEYELEFEKKFENWLKNKAKNN